MAERSARRIAIVGFWEGNRAKAPFQNPDFEIWGLNHLHPYIPRWDRWFDLHRPEWSKQTMKPEVWEDQHKWLSKDHGKPIYMIESYPEYPNSKPYPIEEIGKTFRRYFTNGISYMLAMALWEHVNGQPVDELQVWGVDMRHEEEYAIQRPCTEWWLGIAAGMGMSILIGTDSSLCTADFDYGYEEQGGMVAEALRAHVKVRDDAAKERDRLLQIAQSMDGMVQDNNEWIRRWTQRNRGGVL